MDGRQTLPYGITEGLPVWRPSCPFSKTRTFILYRSAQAGPRLDHVRAVIIGAGIGGLAAAVALRRIGIETLVIERAASIREVGAGLSIWSNAVNALRELGWKPV
jgi:NADPH-dependent 2,4-dienoyl-CoA reductase/sulfur reductase-like enzyme